MKPLCIDLYCGLGGWAEGFLAEGYRVRGYDIEAHDYGTGGYPGTLILRDVRLITGEECKDAAVIVASPPCQEPSYRAMCWKRAKALTPKEVGLPEPSWWKIPEKASKSRRGMTTAEFLAWAEWKHDYPKPAPELFIALFNECFRIQREASEAAGRYIPLIVENVRGAQKWVGRAKWHYGSFYLWGDVPALRRSRDGRKVGMNFHEHEKTGKPGRSFQSCAVEETGTKQGGSWWGPEDRKTSSARFGSKSNARKAASAMIAKIPFPLAQHIARTFKPTEEAIA